MSTRELAAAGITDPALQASYDACRRLNASHGRTYYLATRLLPARKRPYVHALYGFARYADEIVDDLASTLTPDEKAAALEDWARRFLKGGTDDAILPAVLDTIERWSIPREHFEVFLDSMRMDLTVTQYATFDELMQYVEGSAAVIGLQMLPVLEPLPGMAEAAAPYARDLGIAFQLTNFIRDVGEDVRRGRIYLPIDALHAFGLTRTDLERASRTGLVDPSIRRWLAHEIARTREIYRSAAPGVRLLDPSSRPCIETALRLYGGILDAVEAADYRVFDRRVSVPTTRRLAAAARAARAARGVPRSRASS